MPNYTEQELSKLPTLAVGQTDNLKIDTGEERVWLARVGLADGARYRCAITHERLIDGRWQVTREYEGRR